MLTKKPTPTPDPDLEARIKAIWDEVDALIDKRVEELRPQFDFQLPAAMLRRDIELKAWQCRCRQILILNEELRQEADLAARSK
jgi:hypothetical protein